MEYRDRIADRILKDKLETFGGVLILGPKGCGKTTTAKHFAKSFIEFQNEENREKYLAVVEAAPSRLLIGEKPRLFDEWQDAPEIWGAIRKNIDDEQDVGSYILTGSSAMDLFFPSPYGHHADFKDGNVSHELVRKRRIQWLRLFVCPLR